MKGKTVAISAKHSRMRWPEGKMKPEMEKWRETVKFRRQAGTRPVCLDQKAYKFQSSPLPLPQSTGGIWEDRKDILQVLSSPKARACDAREAEIINCCGHWDKLFWTVKNRLPWTERLLTMLRDFFFFTFGGDGKVDGWKQKVESPGRTGDRASTLIWKGAGLRSKVIN